MTIAPLIWLRYTLLWVAFAVAGLGALEPAAGRVSEQDPGLRSFTASNQAPAHPCEQANARSGVVVPLDQLPPEARRTVALIRTGGPFPYAKDGTVFGNRERLLPRKPRAYYREYTVPTPGARDRGPRRIVAGERGELYYTRDHYRSFQRIIE
jgi:ribonuclease T1